jgi:carbon monoxide dehydrogenase subunit G
MRFTETFGIQKSAAAVLDYAADFRNLPQWDPSITAVEKTTPGKIGAGTKFRVHLKFLGFDSTMDYVVDEWTEGKQARLRGTTPVATAIDSITVSGNGKKTMVTWDADIQFIFPINLFDVLFAAAFRPTAMAAVAGLRRVLRDLPAGESSHPS